MECHSLHRQASWDCGHAGPDCRVRTGWAQDWGQACIRAAGTLLSGPLRCPTAFKTLDRCTENPHQRGPIAPLHVSPHPPAASVTTGPARRSCALPAWSARLLHPHRNIHPCRCAPPTPCAAPPRYTHLPAASSAAALTCCCPPTSVRCTTTRGCTWLTCACCCTWRTLSGAHSTTHTNSSSSKDSSGRSSSSRGTAKTAHSRCNAVRFRSHLWIPLPRHRIHRIAGGGAV